MTIYTFYKIVCNDSNVTQIYVGSTVNLKNRISKHKSRCNNPNVESHNAKVYKFIRDNGGWTNWNFKVLEIKGCINKYDASKIEQQHINDLKSELNSNIACFGLAIKEYGKQWYQLNKVKMHEYNKQKLNEKYCCLLCKGPYSYKSITSHEKTIKHQKFVENRICLIEFMKILK